LLIAVGGGCGSMLRYFFGRVAAEHFGPQFPVGTLSINVGACFLIGFVLEFLNSHSGVNPAWRFLVAVGFIGGFSTFSTFTYETWSDLTQGSAWLGVLYAATSIVAGLFAVNVGALAAQRL
jgi:CrcB protein